MDVGPDSIMIDALSFHGKDNSAGNYMLKVNNRNIGTTCELFSQIHNKDSRMAPTAIKETIEVNKRDNRKRCEICSKLIIYRHHRMTTSMSYWCLYC